MDTEFDRTKTRYLWVPRSIGERRQPDAPLSVHPFRQLGLTALRTVWRNLGTDNTNAFFVEYIEDINPRMIFAVVRGEG